MKIRGIESFSILAFASWMSLAAGACVPTTSLLCPTGSSDDGDGACISDSTLSEELGIATALGTALPSFYYLGNNTGFVLGNTQNFSRSSSSSGTSFISDITASFAKGPLLTAGTITEAFTAVAVYSPTQAANAYSNGYSVYDPITGVTTDLTGYIVAVGYALTSDGTVAGLIARYTPRGALDTTFNGTGYILGDSTIFTSGSFTMLKAVAIDGQGRVVVGGYGNAQPTFTNYLNWLETVSDGDPLVLQQTGEELQAMLVRYLPNGALDSSGFDTSSIESPASGSALDGFATSPSSGFVTNASVGTRYDVINGVAVDADDGIFAVGATAIRNSLPGAVSTHAFIAHYSSQGELLTQQRGQDEDGTVYNDTCESFTAVAIDADGNAVAAGNSGTTSVGGGPTITLTNQRPLIAKFTLSNSGTESEILALEESFNSAVTPGYLVATAIPALASNTIKALAIDSSAGVYVLSGHTLTGGKNETLVMTVDSASATVTDSLEGPADGYATGNVSALDSLHGIAVIKNGDTTRYMGAGYSYAPDTVTHSLITSLETTLDLDTADFASSPYLEADAALKFPNTYLPSFITTPGNTYWVPFDWLPFVSTAGTQLGPLSAVYGGGKAEKFNAVAPSADGTHAIVVGYTTDAAYVAGTMPTNQRSFPILLIYRQDGNFVNLGDYSDFSTLQNAL